MPQQRDHRKLPRRRGAALNSAIFKAVREEIAESGYAGLTMDSVAERARASKASLYRRWPGRAALVLEAAYDAMPGPASAPDTGSLRGDALAILRLVAQQLEGAVGQAMRGLLGEALQNPAVAAEIREYARGNVAKIMRAIIEQAASRGECDPSVATETRIEAGPALLRQRFIFSGAPIDDEFLVHVVDEVMLPLLMAGPPN
ncbi:TetR/AcrR family transcriptional regulator [Arthrobacter bambusae]|jgi:AcrR family transcriptional regulator|uniref:TetR/AcrR family transcriptional regulator n=1 Tax=Arthrobacter TaxID=1663 RepID=UPI001F50E616|nr:MULTISPECIES: TetR/AcrR family transcriptional regulator [Arthrobacter]MCI0142753.1 TetR/AcrR family transcriptional regulator [Arthrobacter bambusae]UYY82034.1 TetR/AcrR family transcriptional regulator [Arthrobacter sp. YA7-1]